MHVGRAEALTEALTEAHTEAHTEAYSAQKKVEKGGRRHAATWHGFRFVTLLVA